MRTVSLSIVATLALLVVAAPGHAATRTGQQTVGGTTMSATYDGETQLTVIATNRAISLDNPLAVKPPAKIDARLQSP